MQLKKSMADMMKNLNKIKDNQDLKKKMMKDM